MFVQKKDSGRGHEWCTMNPTMEPAQTQPPVLSSDITSGDVSNMVSVDDIPTKVVSVTESAASSVGPSPVIASIQESVSAIAPQPGAAAAPAHAPGVGLSPTPSTAPTPLLNTTPPPPSSLAGMLPGEDLNLSNQQEKALIQDAMSSVAEAVADAGGASGAAAPPLSPAQGVQIPVEPAMVALQPASAVVPMGGVEAAPVVSDVQPVVAPMPEPEPSIVGSSGAKKRDISENSTVLDVLLDSNAITQDQYDEINLEHVTTGKEIEAIVEDKQLVTMETLTKARADLYHVPYIRLSDLGVSPEALGQVPAVLAKRYQLIPFAVDKSRRLLSVAMKNPLDLGAIDFLEKKTGLRVDSYFAIPAEIEQAITDRYAQSLSAEVSAAMKETGEESKAGVRLKTFDSKSLGNVIREAPIAKIVETILTFAIKARASDVHLEPQEDRTRVRYRIDGILHEKLILPKSVQDAVVSRIKILSDLKIDEKRIPQDGRFTFRVEKEEVDLRISTLPTVHGEKIVMRLLKKSGGVPSLNELGLRGAALKSLEAAAVVPHGIVLVTGPTGSGKTTTLYSLLYKINSPKVNIMTLEDPVEYQMAGVNQVQINPAAGLTFASGLRSFLRQDPNIIMVGEIRDSETAELAIQASLTGHLVFSTLHTNSAAGALPRMLDMGAEPFLLTSSITLVMAQRVVRKICSDCKEEYTPEPAVVEDLKKVLGPLYDGWLQEHKGKPTTLFKGKGCDNCGNTGYQGRIGIFEVLVVNEKVSRLILERRPAQEIEEQGVKDGMLLMKQDGYMKALDGITTVEEVLRVAQV